MTHSHRTTSLLLILSLLLPLTTHGSDSAVSSTTTTTTSHPTHKEDRALYSSNIADCVATTLRAHEQGISSGGDSSGGHRRELSSTAGSDGAASVNDTNATSTSFAHASGTHAHASAQEVGFFTLCMFIGVVCRTWLEPKICFRFVPYTVCLISIGVCIGALSIFTQYDDSTSSLNHHCHLGKVQTKLPMGCDYDVASCTCLNWFDRLNVNILADISPHVILYIFLPPLIFESAFFMDIHIFVRSFWGIMALAVLGVTVATGVTGLILMYGVSQFNFSCLDYSPLANFDTAMMVGAMLSATDPVAVVQLLKSLGASPELGTLIEGESLMNDGTAYAMFLIFQARSQYHEVQLHMPSEVCTLEDSLMKAVNNGSGTGCLDNVEGVNIFNTALNLIALGPIIGYFVGRIAVTIVEFIYNDVIIETAITVLAAYTSWCVAEAVGSSGVLSVVLTGLAMSHSRGLAFTEKAKHFLHEFWEMVGCVFFVFFVLASACWCCCCSCCCSCSCSCSHSQSFSFTAFQTNLGTFSTP